MAKRDESFNEFLKNFKAKNEQNWANILDLSQEEQENKLLEKTPDYRKNEMIMLEEFRRRRNLKKYYEMMKVQKKSEAEADGQKNPFVELNTSNINKEMSYKVSGPERFFTPSQSECFNPNDFPLIFLDSDSVTNVTSLNRTNQRRILLFIGNGNGIISHAMGKGNDYEQAFEACYKKLRKNLICIPLDQRFTVP